MGEEQTSEPVNQSDTPTGEDFEALYDSIMQPEVETSAPTESEQKESGAAPESQAVKKEDVASGEFLLKHPSLGDEGRHFDRDKTIDYAQKGFDYEVKMKDLKSERKSVDEDRRAFEEERTEWTKQHEEWTEIDRYMKENPRFEQIVREQWAREQGSTYEPPNPQVQALQDQVKSLMARLDAKDTETREVQTKQATENLQKTVAAYKESNAELDWEGKDEFGKTLEERIEEYAVENEIKSFTNAANLMLFDQLQKLAVTRAKETAGKSIQKQNKLGLGPVTDRPTQAGDVSNAYSYREKSYEQLAGEALEEMGIG